MNFFLIMIAPMLVVFLSLAIYFLWGIVGKEV